MTRLTDGNKTVEITMTVWGENGFSPDWSCDFFAVGNLQYDEDTESYIVPDVDCCVDQAKDWQNSEGDFSDNEADDNRHVFIDYIQRCRRKIEKDNEFYWICDDALTAYAEIDEEKLPAGTSEEQAYRKAESEWTYLTSREQQKRDSFELLIAEEDEDGCMNLETATVVHKFK